MPKTRILLVDDHQIMIDGMLLILEDLDDIEVIGSANNGKEAIERCRQFKPDLVLMDLDMPVTGGMPAAKVIKTDMPEIKVIILSLHAEKSIIQNLIQSGIDGYLVKNSDKEEVIRAIRDVIKGNRYFSAAVTMALSSPFMSSNSKPKSIDLQEKLSLLSKRETEVLKHIAEGYSNKEIADLLYLSYRTVDAHRANIMKKLEISKVTGLVRFALKTGLID